MRTLAIAIIGMLMTANAAIAQLVDPEIYIPLAFSGTNCGFDCGEAGIIGIGRDPNGSDGYDDNLDIPAFPGAPGGDGRVIFNSDVIPLGLTRDVRQLGLIIAAPGFAQPMQRYCRDHVDLPCAVADHPPVPDGACQERAE